MAKRLSQDSSASFAGIIYQFYLALERCFELNENEMLYIEKKGDIAITGTSSVSIEVKHYQDKLTDSHPNVWKTLANLLKKEFNYSQYKKLILITTQQISSSCLFLNWNEKKPGEKQQILLTICQQRTGGESELSKYQQVVFAEINKNYFTEFIAKFEIYDSSDSLTEVFDKLTNQKAKHLGNNKKSREKYIKGLVGFMLSPKVIVENGWTVKFEEFAEECELLSQSLSVNTRVFPTKSGKTPQKLIGNELYIQKIKDINYGDAVDEAHSAYSETLEIINERLSTGTLAKNFTIFQNEVLSIFETEYRRAKRNVREVMSSSQDFYDECQTRTVPPFSQFETPHSWFRNGVLHSCMEQKALNIKWKLE